MFWYFWAVFLNFFDISMKWAKWFFKLPEIPVHFCFNFSRSFQFEQLIVLNFDGSLTAFSIHGGCENEHHYCATTKFNTSAKMRHFATDILQRLARKMFLVVAGLPFKPWVCCCCCRSHHINSKMIAWSLAKF